MMRSRIVFLVMMATIAVWATGESRAFAQALAKKSAPVKKTPKLTEDVLRQNELENYIQLIDQANTQLQYLRSEKEIDCVDCTAASAGTGYSTLDTPPAAKICKDKWADFYKKDVIDLRITFGYIDQDFQSVASDYLQKQALVDQVTKSCEQDNDLVRACGFSRAVDDEDVFEKVQNGPDGKPRMIRLRITASSSTPSDRLNRSFREQQDQSAKAEEQFYSGLCEAEMSLYVGHARDGGGPDFRPAVRRANGSINLATYRAEKPGLGRVEESLSKCPQNPSKLIGFLACDSSRWDRALSAAAPKAGLLLSATPRLNSYVPVAQAYLALDSVLWQRCNIPAGASKNGSFDEAMGQIPEYDGQTVIPIKLKNFFK